MDGCWCGGCVVGVDPGAGVMVAAWLVTIAVIAVGIGLVHGVFRLMGPDYEDRNHH